MRLCEEEEGWDIPGDLRRDIRDEKDIKDKEV
jgi:hypothetical protein